MSSLPQPASAILNRSGEWKRHLSPDLKYIYYHAGYGLSYTDLIILQEFLLELLLHDFTTQGY